MGQSKSGRNMILGAAIIVMSLVMLVFTAAGRSDPGPNGLTMAYAHMAICAFMSVAFIALGLLEARKVRETGEVGAARISGIVAQHTGLVFAWGAVGLMLTYGTSIVTWKEWPGFLAVFAVLALVSFFTARTHFAAADAGQIDPRFWKISRYLGMALTVGMIIVMVGLLVDGKMARFLEIQRENWQDWAANNYFFFGAFALAVLGGYGVHATSGMVERQQAEAR
jgi:bacteriorhodopsin